MKTILWTIWIELTRISGLLDEFDDDNSTAVAVIFLLLLIVDISGFFSNIYDRFTKESE